MQSEECSIPFNSGSSFEEYDLRWSQGEWRCSAFAWLARCRTPRRLPYVTLGIGLSYLVWQQRGASGPRRSDVTDPHARQYFYTVCIVHIFSSTAVYYVYRHPGRSVFFANCGCQVHVSQDIYGINARIAIGSRSLIGRVVSLDLQATIIVRALCVE